MKLFEPCQIGTMKLKNRIVMGAMGARGLSELDGRISQRGIDYFLARVRGGVGLLITGSMSVGAGENNLIDGQWSVRPRIDNAIFVTRLNEFTDAVHHYGAKIAAQLTAGFGRVARATASFHPVAPSPIPCFWNPDVIARELSREEIADIVKAFGNTARIAQMAGFDAIEIHGHGGYLLDQFKTALWNKRTDKYGGDLDRRLRFPLEVIEAVKNAVDLPVIYRFTARHFAEGGRGIEESIEVARRLESAGIDALNVDDGCYEVWYRHHPTIYQAAGCMVESAAAIKKAVKIPVIAAGKLGNPQVAERVLEEGKADLIALARPLLADAEWAKKVKERRFEDIRPCIGDHDGCLTRVLIQGRYLSCSVNPQTGMEKEYALTPAEKVRRVLVIGGGPGGLEAAQVAALRGHRVTLWEKNDKLGGNLLAASAPGFKQELRDLINYFTAQVKKLGIEVELNKEATLKSITEMSPEVVIIATGAAAVIPEIPGVKMENVATAIDVLLGKKDTGELVIVAGGGIVGCETAVYLAQKGKRVTLVEMMPQLVNEEMNLANKMMLLDMVKTSGIATVTGACIQEITRGGVIASFNGAKQGIAGDSVVLALGMKSQSRLQESIKEAPFEVFAIGDCVKPRRILNAVWEGFHTSRLI